ncbi:MAG: flagellar biosynthesis anti-sigma factor FlgM [Clostridiales bacterium]|jgi:negative regulator of flagellin synthesis FlgM|nr:flagellar biosynthesis anti-sigma factor FlgM [Clostridiales bacterium]
MNINAMERTQRAYPIQSAKAVRHLRESAKESQSSFALSLSSSAKEFQIAKNATAAVPEIRSELVASISERIKSGTYNVSAKDVAEKIVG